MSYSFEIDTAAARKVRKLPADIRSLVKERLAALIDDPRPHNAIRLKGTTNGWRIRVGKMRILYKIEEQAKLVVVYDVDSRDNAYKDLS